MRSFTGTSHPQQQHTYPNILNPFIFHRPLQPPQHHGRALGAHAAIYPPARSALASPRLKQMSGPRHSTHSDICLSRPQMTIRPASGHVGVPLTQLPSFQSAVPSQLRQPRTPMQTANKRMGTARLSYPALGGQARMVGLRRCHGWREWKRGSRRGRCRRAWIRHRQWWR